LKRNGAFLTGSVMFKNLKAVLHFFLFSLFATTSLSAYSEVTISGTVDQAYETVKLTNITGKLKINRIEPTLSNYNELKFTGSENLGPGLKAIFEISFKDVGPDDTDKIASNYTSFVGLEGGFGKSGKAKVFFKASIDPSAVRSTSENAIELCIKKYLNF
jgi:hypothetical protein